MSCTGGYLDLDANSFSPILSFKMDKKQYKSLVFLRSRPHDKLSKPRATLWDVIGRLARCGQAPATLWIKLWVQKLMAGKCILLWNSVLYTFIRSSASRFYFRTAGSPGKVISISCIIFRLPNSQRNISMMTYILNSFRCKKGH